MPTLQMAPLPGTMLAPPSFIQLLKRYINLFVEDTALMFFGEHTTLEKDMAAVLSLPMQEG